MGRNIPIQINRVARLGAIFSLVLPGEAPAQTQDAPAGMFAQLWSDFTSALYDLYQNPDAHEIDFGIGFTVIALIGVGLAYYLTRRALNRVYALLEAWRGSRISSLKIQSYEVLSADRITDLLKKLANAVRIIVLVVVIYLAIPLVLSFFPGTREWVAALMPYLMAPVYQVLWGFVAFLPNLLSIIIIVIVSRYLIRMIRAIFSEISGGRIVFPGFHSEWAAPTSKLLSFLVVVFAVVLVSPYLPGFGSPAFQGISIFLGVLLSLGSTAAIANMVAGTALTYMRAFKVGDRVRIADTLGDVTEKTLLVTRVRTIKNVEVTIPNALVLGGHMINFSALADGPGLVLHTTVTIGYDAPWRHVHELLIAAARATQDIAEEPPPFVLQTNLNDFSIAYEINACTKAPQRTANILSELHQKIQDHFNRAGVEIMSPNFAALRDGNTPAMPTEHLPPISERKAFRILPVDGSEKIKS
jgi:small-conductance mechanosensitive channel